MQIVDGESDINGSNHVLLRIKGMVKNYPGFMPVLPAIIHHLGHDCKPSLTPGRPAPQPGVCDILPKRECHCRDRYPISPQSGQLRASSLGSASDFQAFQPPYVLLPGHRPHLKIPIAPDSSAHHYPWSLLPQLPPRQNHEAAEPPPQKRILCDRVMVEISLRSTIHPVRAQW